jgi:outer membrane murein-binding lipoprotein Lpp
VPGTPTGVQVGENVISLSTRPLTAADVSALRAKRSELSRQLNSAQGRRNEVVQELRRSPDGAARTGLEQRLQVLDGRIMQIEQDIALNGRELARAPLELAQEEAANGAVRYGPFSSGQLTGITIVGTLGVLMPLAIASAIALLRRAKYPKPAPQVLESAARLERMEQAIDAMAVEIERISEGQRFVTQLMAAKEPVKVLADSNQ